MFADLILMILALIALAIASIIDIKIKEVPDWLSYSLIFSAFIIRLIASIVYNNIFYFLYAAIGFIILLIIGTIFYYSKQWGGGDTKLLMALGIVFATKPYFTPENSFPFLIILVFNILLIGAVYGLIWSFILMFKNWQKFKIRFRIKIRDKKVKLAEKIIALIIGINITLLFIVKDNFLRLGIMILTGLIIVYLYLWIAIKSVESLSMYKTIPVENLREGDWIAKNIYVRNQLVYKRNSGISKEDIQKIINSSVRTITIKEGIPFVPPFLIGTIISLITGKILFLI